MFWLYKKKKKRERKGKRVKHPDKENERSLIALYVVRNRSK
jgi:hypothetical protein